MVTIPYATKYHTISASSSTGFCTSNISETPSTPLRNQRMQCFSPAIIMVFMSPRCYSPIQGRARELDVRLNSPDPTQYTPLLARLISTNTQPNQHHNLIRDDILSLVQYGIHFRNPDKPVLIITLQFLLHDLPQLTLLDQSLSHSPNINTSPFTITGDCHEHTPYAHNQDLHQWFDAQLSTDTVDQHDN